MKKRLALLLVVCLMISLVTACTPSTTPAPSGDDKTPETEKPEPDPAKEPDTKPEAGAFPEGKIDGIMDVCISSEPETIDPALNTSVDGAVMLQHSFEGLIKWVDDGEGNAVLAPGQAESWDVSEDQLTWTFHLRDGLKWSDGQPVTAEDFVYGWQRLVNPMTAADYEYMLDMVEGYADKVADADSLDAKVEAETKDLDPEDDAEEIDQIREKILAEVKDKQYLNIKAVDDKTFEVKLAALTPYFEEICAFPAAFPVRKDIVEGNDQWTMEKDTFISNGPYQMTEWVHNSYITFEKNPEYYDADKMTAETIKFHLKDDQNAIFAGYRSNELDFIQGVPQDEIGALLESGELVVWPQVGTYFVCFQTQEEPFDNPLVRKAFALAIDRNFIVETITQGGQIPASGFVPAGINDAAGAGSDDFRTVGGDYYPMSADDYAANCEEARKLLAEAGYPDGQGFPVVTYLYNTSQGHQAIGEALQNMWQTELGVQVTLENQDWAVFLVERKAGNFSIARHGWIADYNDPMTFLDMWMTGGGNNDAQYVNPKYDELIKKAKASSDPAERMKLMHEAEDIAVGEDFIVAPIYFYTSSHMMKPNIEGLYYTPLGYHFFGMTTGY